MPPRATAFFIRNLSFTTETEGIAAFGAEASMHPWRVRNTVLPVVGTRLESKRPTIGVRAV
jgi:hypothetical protein